MATLESRRVVSAIRLDAREGRVRRVRRNGPSALRRGRVTQSAIVRCLSVALVFGVVVANADPVTSASDYEELAPLDSHPQTSVAIIDRLRHYHFESKPLDDDLSSRILDKYIAFLDPKRIHFLAADVAELEEYRAKLDDALEQGDLQPAFDIYNRFHRRTLERIEYDVALLQRGVDQFDFTLDEAVELNRDDAPWPADRAAAESLWRQSLKSGVLGSKLAGESPDTIAEKLTKRVKNRLRAVRQTRSEDVFQTYINAFAQTYDQYTQYFSPRASEDFNIAMSLSLEGIGAVLGRSDDYTVVQSLVKGGPADQGGDLKRTDRIVGVSQSAKEPFVDIVGWRTDEVVQLIRGPKDSPVLLKVFADGADAADTRVVEIVRNVVKLEDQDASRSVLSVEQNGREHRVGVVVVPTFYMDFKALREGDPNYKSTTRDVARLIDELDEEGIDALVVDLRNNGGGSLQEARELTGLFVESGPVVQVASQSRTAVLGDMDNGSAAWNGPLAVIVNRFSASASEIFAGAIQDYGLGVVVGNQTFGKGTVQTLIPLPVGELKVTERMYYRVSGESPEQNGIVPDIVFPEPKRDWAGRDKSSFGAIDGGMATLPSVEFSPSNKVGAILDALRARHDERARTDAEFAYLRARKDYVERLQQRTHLSLQEQIRLAEKDADDAWILEVENARLIARGEQPVATVDELAERREAEVDDEAKPADDIVMRETANILADVIDLSLPLAMAGGTSPAATLPGDDTTTAVQ